MSAGAPGRSALSGDPMSPPPDPSGRTFTCLECGALIEVFELPEPFLAPHDFVCGQCLHDPEPEVRAL